MKTFLPKPLIYHGQESEIGPNPRRRVSVALALELQEGAVIGDDVDGERCVFLAGLYRAECEISERLKSLASGEPSWPSIDADKALPWVEKRTTLERAQMQRAAVRTALASKVLVITGGLGIGKTMLVNSILKILLAKAVEIALRAPTGRTAERLSESTGLEAKAIHWLLETDPRTGAFRRNEETPLECDLLVVDETLDGRRAAALGRDAATGHDDRCGERIAAGVLRWVPTKKNDNHYRLIGSCDAACRGRVGRRQQERLRAKRRPRNRPGEARHGRS